MARYRKRSVTLAGVVALAVVTLAGTSMLSVGQAQAPVTATVDPARTRLFDRGTYYLGVATRLSARRDLGYEVAPVAQAIRQLGFNSYRDGIVWYPGRPDDGAAPTPKLAAMLAQGGARPLLVLAGDANGPGSAPLDEVRRAEFAHFAARAVGSTIAAAPLYEIWNEWNRSAYPKAKPMTTAGSSDDPRFAGRYAAVAQSAAGAIVAAHPGAKVLVGAAAIDPQWSWVSGVVRGGGLRGAAGLSVHLYNQCNRRTRGSDELLARLRSLDGTMRSIVGRSIDVYVTEWGWSTGTACQVDSDFVAASSAQFLFGAAALPFVKGTWQYELKDTGGDPSDLEDSFGVLDAQFRPKPSACAVRDAMAVLRTVRAIGPAPSAPGSSAVIARTSDETVALLWSEVTAAVARTAAATRVTSLCGGTRAVDAGEAIPLGAMPVVVHLGATPVPLRVTVG